MAKEPEMVAKSHTFLQQMKDLQTDLKKASSHLTPKQQQDGTLIERLPEFKDKLQEAWHLLDETLKRGVDELGLKKKEDPLKSMQDNIRALKDPQDKLGHLRATASFTSIIQHTSLIRATVKSLQRAAKKALNAEPGSATSTRYFNQMHHCACKMIFQADQYRLGERLVDAIEYAEHQQGERQKIQDCYSKWRRKLDKFEGEGRRDNSLNIGEEKRRTINKLLEVAGCSNLFGIEQEKQCEIIEDEEARNWNKVKQVYESYDESCRWIDMMADKKFHQAIHESLMML